MANRQTHLPPEGIAVECRPKVSGLMGVYIVIVIVVPTINLRELRIQQLRSEPIVACCGWHNKAFRNLAHHEPQAGTLRPDAQVMLSPMSDGAFAKARNEFDS